MSRSDVYRCSEPPSVPYIYSINILDRQQPCLANMDLYPFLPSLQQGTCTAAVGLLVYSLVRVIYNVYFHPLSHFPGPRGAACSRWWLAYMELGRGISLSTLREGLHMKYGTVFP